MNRGNKILSFMNQQWKFLTDAGVPCTKRFHFVPEEEEYSWADNALFKLPAATRHFLENDLPVVHIDGSELKALDMDHLLRQAKEAEQKYNAILEQLKRVDDLVKSLEQNVQKLLVPSKLTSQNISAIELTKLVTTLTLGHQKSPTQVLAWSAPASDTCVHEAHWDKVQEYVDSLRVTIGCQILAADGEILGELGADSSTRAEGSVARLVQDSGQFYEWRMYTERQERDYQYRCYGQFAGVWQNDVNLAKEKVQRLKSKTSARAWPDGKFSSAEATACNLLLKAWPLFGCDVEEDTLESKLGTACHSLALMSTFFEESARCFQSKQLSVQLLARVKKVMDSFLDSVSTQKCCVLRDGQHRMTTDAIIARWRAAQKHYLAALKTLRMCLTKVTSLENDTTTGTDLNQGRPLASSRQGATRKTSATAGCQRMEAGIPGFSVDHTEPSPPSKKNCGGRKMRNKKCALQFPRNIIDSTRRGVAVALERSGCEHSPLSHHLSLTAGQP